MHENTIALYVYEPDHIAAAEYDTSHHIFLNQCLIELTEGLRQRGIQLITRKGDISEILHDINRSHGVCALYSHRETGHARSFQRDTKVKLFCQEHGIPWHEFSQNGVIRRLKSRDGWAGRWTARMSEPLAEIPTTCSPYRDRIKSDGILDADVFDKPGTTKKILQAGGFQEANKTITSFFESRGKSYATEMSSPVTAGHSCSRLSTHLAFGTVSMRQVYHQLLHYLALAEDSPPTAAIITKKSLRAFEARLRWHCHFMQKLEDDPRIEFSNMVTAYDGIRDELIHPAHLEQWATGQTGYPMVDACMRALLATSWINFRMRAMLVSFASYDLWLPWQLTARHLAKHFLDFEPGIHYSQVQMQSGTTGINTIRIYNPTKQLTDHDPHGLFVRAYVPELAAVPDDYLAEPWTMPKQIQQKVGCIIGKNYPEPIIDHSTATKEARLRLGSVRRSTVARAEAKDILAKHGSRKRPRKSQARS
jgi:deoxyribodipyrimidine photo-lyase